MTPSDLRGEILRYLDERFELFGRELENNVKAKPPIIERMNELSIIRAWVERNLRERV